MLPGFVETAHWVLPADFGRVLGERNPAAILNYLADELRRVEIDHDRAMYDFIAGQISED